MTNRVVYWISFSSEEVWKKAKQRHIVAVKRIVMVVLIRNRKS